jgi:multicomponent K+:H+ antiporter subunit E
MKLRRWLPRPGLTLFLALLWLLMVNTLNPGQVLLALFLGWAIALLCKEFLIDIPPVRRPLKLCLFVVQVFWDIVVANLHVARLVLGPQRNLNPAFVEVPMAIEDEFLLSALASIISLTPGTVSAGLTPDHKILLLHALDVPDSQALIAEVKQRYEAPLLEIFACSPM